MAAGMGLAQYRCDHGAEVTRLAVQRILEWPESLSRRPFHRVLDIHGDSAETDEGAGPRRWWRWPAHPCGPGRWERRRAGSARVCDGVYVTDLVARRFPDPVHEHARRIRP